MDELQASDVSCPYCGELINVLVDPQEVLLNTRHRLVSRALSQSTSSPLASTLRLLVGNALAAAGAAIKSELRRQQQDDLDWIAEALWGRDE